MSPGGPLRACAERHLGWVQAYVIIAMYSFADERAFNSMHRLQWLNCDPCRRRVERAQLTRLTSPLAGAQLWSGGCPYGASMRGGLGGSGGDEHALADLAVGEAAVMCI